jgi:hypothetical protein
MQKYMNINNEIFSSLFLLQNRENGQNVRGKIPKQHNYLDIIDIYKILYSGNGRNFLLLSHRQKISAKNIINIH